MAKISITPKRKTSDVMIQNIKKAMTNPSPGALRIPKNF